MKIIVFEISTSDFKHAVELCEEAFGYEGEEWDSVKNSGDIEELAEFLEADDVDSYVISSEVTE